MIVAFDPVAKDVTIDLEDGHLPLSFPATRLVVSHYGDLGVLCAEVTDADKAQLAFYPVASTLPAPMIQVAALGLYAWHVTATVADR